MGCQDSAETDRQWQERDDRVKYLERGQWQERDDRVEYLERELIDLAKAVSNDTASGIHVIKAYRAATGSSLTISKAWWESHRINREPAPSELSAIRTRLEKVEKWQAAFDAALDGRKP